MLPVVFGTARSAQVSRYFLKTKDFVTVTQIFASALVQKDVEGFSSARHFLEGRCTWGDLERSLKLIGRFSFSRFYSYTA